MKKKIIALCALVCCILLFSGGIAFVELYVPDTGAVEDTGSGSVAVTDISVAEVGAVAVTNGTGTYGLMIYNSYIELIPVNGGAGVSVDAEKCSQSELRAFVYAMCHLSAERCLGRVENPEDYGYSSPDSTVTLLKNDGSSVVLRLLKSAAVGDGVYLYNEASGELFTVSASDAALLRRSAADFMSHSIIPEISASGLSGVEYIEVGGSGVEPFRIENLGGTFYLTEPLSQRLRTSLLYSKLLSPLSSLYGESCLAAGDALDEYGFDKPDTVISLSLDGRVYSIGFVNGENGSLMADMLSGAVYSIDRDAVLSVSTDWEEFLGGSPYYYSFGDCGSITVSAGGNEVSYEISGSGESMTVTAGGEALDSDKIISLSNAINGTRIADRLSDTPEGESELTLIFSLTGGSHERVDFIKRGNDCAAVVNGTANFTVPGADVQAIISEVFG